MEDLNTVDLDPVVEVRILEKEEEGRKEVLHCTSITKNEELIK